MSHLKDPEPEEIAKLTLSVLALALILTAGIVLLARGTCWPFC